MSLGTNSKIKTRRPIGSIKDGITDKVNKSKIPDRHKQVFINIIVKRSSECSHPLPFKISSKYINFIKMSPYYYGQGPEDIKYGFIIDLPVSAMEELYNVISARDDWYNVMSRYSS